MLKSIVLKRLNSQLGTLVEGIHPEQATVEFFRREIILEDLTLRKGALRRLGVPLDVHQGHIRRVRLKLSFIDPQLEPYLVEVDDVVVVALPRYLMPFDREYEEEMERGEKAAGIRDYEAAPDAADSASVAPPWRDAHTLQKLLLFKLKLLLKVAGNIQLTLRRLHLRCEDWLASPLHEIAWGVLLNELTVASADAAWKPAKPDPQADLVRKALAVDHLAVYLNDGEPEERRLRDLPKADLVLRMLALIPCGSTATTTTATSATTSFILRPLNCEARAVFTSTFEELDLTAPKVVVSVTADALDLALRRGQYHALLALALHAVLPPIASRHRQHRPPRGVTPRSAQGARAWWRYLQHCVLGHIHQRNHRWSWGFFAARRQARLKYTQLYQAAAAAGWKRAPSALLGDLAALERHLSIEDILLYRKLVRKRLAAAREQQTPQHEHTHAHSMQDHLVRRDHSLVGVVEEWIWWQLHSVHDAPLVVDRARESFGGAFSEDEMTELFDALRYSARELRNWEEMPRSYAWLQVTAEVAFAALSLFPDDAGAEPLKAYGELLKFTYFRKKEDALSSLTVSKISLLNQDGVFLAPHRCEARFEERAQVDIFVSRERRDHGTHLRLIAHLEPFVATFQRTAAQELLDFLRLPDDDRYLMRVVKFASATAKTALYLAAKRLRQYLIDCDVESAVADLRLPVLVLSQSSSHLLADLGAARIEYTSVPRRQILLTGVLLHRLALSHRGAQLVLARRLPQGFKVLKSPALTRFHLARQSEPATFSLSRGRLVGRVPEVVVQLTPSQLREVVHLPGEVFALLHSTHPFRLLSQLEYDPFFRMTGSGVAPAHLHVGLRIPELDPRKPTVVKLVLTVGRVFLVLAQDPPSAAPVSPEADPPSAPSSPPPSQLLVLTVTELHLLAKATRQQQELDVSAQTLEVEAEGHAPVCAITRGDPSHASLVYHGRKVYSPSPRVSHTLQLSIVSLVEPAAPLDFLLDFARLLESVNLPPRVIGHANRLPPDPLLPLPDSEARRAVEEHAHLKVELAATQLDLRLRGPGDAQQAVVMSARLPTAALSRNEAGVLVARASVLSFSASQQVDAAPPRLIVKTAAPMHKSFLEVTAEHNPQRAEHPTAVHLEFRSLEVIYAPELAGLVAAVQARAQSAVDLVRRLGRTRGVDTEEEEAGLRPATATSSMTQALCVFHDFRAVLPLGTPGSLVVTLPLASAHLADTSDDLENRVLSLGVEVAGLALGLDDGEYESELEVVSGEVSVSGKGRVHLPNISTSHLRTDLSLEVSPLVMQLRTSQLAQAERVFCTLAVLLTPPPTASVSAAVREGPLVRLRLRSSGAGISLTNDFGKWAHPLASAELAVFQLALERTCDGLYSVKSELTLQALLFNTRLLRWEPVLEAWGVAVQHVPSSAAGQESVLSVRASTAMEWNLSTTMLQTMSHALGEYRRPDRAPAANVHELAPFVVENTTGYSVTVRPAGGVQGEAELEIRSSESRPYAPPGFEWSAVHGDAAMPVAVDIDLALPEGRTLAMRSLRIDTEGATHFGLSEGDADEAELGKSRRPHLVCEVVWSRSHKRVVLRSALQLVNHTASRLQVMVGLENRPPYLVWVAPEEVCNLPLFASSWTSLRLRPHDDDVDDTTMDYEWSQEVLTVGDLRHHRPPQPPLCFTSLAKDNANRHTHHLLQPIPRVPSRVFGFGEELAVLPSPAGFVDVAIRVTPTLLLANHLPFEVALAVADLDSQSGFMRTVRAGECLTLTAANVAHRLSLAVDLPQLGFNVCAGATIVQPGASSSSRPTSVRVENDRGDALELVLAYELRHGLAPEVVHLYCPLLVRNETGLPVHIRRASALPVPNLQGGVCLQPRSDRANYLVPLEELGVHHAIRVDHSAWSAPLDLSTIEVFDAISLARDGASGLAAELVATVTEYRQDPVAYKTITLLPRFSLSNDSAVAVECAECAADGSPLDGPPLVAALEPGERTSLHFASADSRLRLREAQGRSQWSAPLPISHTDHLVVQLRRTPSSGSRLLFVSVFLEGPAVTISVQEYGQVPPFELVNELDEPVDVAQQEGLQVCRAEPHESAPFVLARPGRADRTVHLLFGDTRVTVDLAAVTARPEHRLVVDTLERRVALVVARSVDAAITLRLTEDLSQAVSETPTGSPAATKTRVEIELPAVGLSLVNAVPEEVVHFTASGISLEGESSPVESRLRLKVLDLQADNTLADAAFPRLAYRHSLRSKEPTLQGALVASSSASAAGLRDVPQLTVKLQSLSVGIDDRLVRELGAFSGEIQGLVSAAAALPSAGEEATPARYFVDVLCLAAGKFFVSSRTSPAVLHESGLVTLPPRMSGSAASAVATAVLSNLTDLPIRFSPLELRDVVLTPEAGLTLLRRHVRAQAHRLTHILFGAKLQTRSLIDKLELDVPLEADDEDRRAVAEFYQDAGTFDPDGVAATPHRRWPRAFRRGLLAPYDALEAFGTLLLAGMAAKYAQLAADTYVTHVASHAAENQDSTAVLLVTDLHLLCVKVPAVPKEQAGSGGGGAAGVLSQAELQWMARSADVEEVAASPRGVYFKAHGWDVTREVACASVATRKEIVDTTMRLCMAQEVPEKRLS